MTWPSSDVSDTNVSSGSATGAPAAVRLDFKDLIDKFNLLRNHVTSFGQTLLGRTTPALMRSDLGVAPRATRIDVASVAGTVDLTASAPDTDDIRLTGSLVVTGFTVAAGRVIRVTASGAPTLTNNANIVTNTGANITLAAGDTFSLRATAANVVEVLGAVQVPAASETVAGKVELATAAEVYFGTDSTRAVTALGIKTALGFSKYYASPEATVAFNGVTPFTHGLGVRPMFVRLHLRCLTAEAGYAVGDEISYCSMDNYTTYGLTLSMNATQVTVALQGGMRVFHKSTTVGTGITAANWRWVVYAWA